MSVKKITRLFHIFTNALGLRQLQVTFLVRHVVFPLAMLPAPHSPQTTIREITNPLCITEIGFNLSQS